LEEAVDLSYDRLLMNELPNTYLHMSVFNVLPSGVNTFFSTFWKHPDALFKKGLWSAAYPLPNSLDDHAVHSPRALCPL
jgi:hypothetical protein